MLLHGGGRGVLKGSFSLAWLVRNYDAREIHHALTVSSLRGRGVGPSSNANMAVRRTFRPPQYARHFLGYIYIYIYTYTNECVSA